MPDNTLPESRSPTEEMMAHYSAILANFKDRMSLTQAEELYDMTHGELKAAIDNGKCRFYKCGTRYKVSHQFIGEYIEKWCTHQNEPLPC